LHSLAQAFDPAAWSAVLGGGWLEMGTPEFWVAVAKIIWINVLLSGDNAVVIALACRGLPDLRRRHCRAPAHRLHRCRRLVDAAAVSENRRRAGRRLKRLVILPL
jgi:hypothetical protein